MLLRSALCVELWRSHIHSGAVFFSFDNLSVIEESRGEIKIDFLRKFYGITLLVNLDV